MKAQQSANRKANLRFVSRGFLDRKLSNKWFASAVLISLAAHILLLPLPLTVKDAVRKPHLDQSSSGEGQQQSGVDSESSDGISVETIPFQSLQQPSIQQPSNRASEQALDQTPDQASAKSAVNSAPPAPPPTASSQPAVQPAQPPAASIAAEGTNDASADEVPTRPPPDPAERDDPALDADKVVEPVMPPGPERGMVVALSDDFPHLTSAESGCLGLNNCHRVSGEGGYGQVGRRLVAQMEAQGYQVVEQDDNQEDRRGYRVYEVVMPNETQVTYYLNVLSDGLDSIVYAMTLEPMSLLELQQLTGSSRNQPYAPVG